jgi:hypothetical protein
LEPFPLASLLVLAVASAGEPNEAKAVLIASKPFCRVPLPPLSLSPFYTRNSTEWDTDLLFKKPWTISPKAEFMLGIGPQWVYLRQNGKSTNSIAGEVAGDFMFWPARKHRFGWFLEPSYDYSFARGHQQSIGMSGGLLIAIH